MAVDEPNIQRLQAKARRSIVTGRFLSLDLAQRPEVRSTSERHFYLVGSLGPFQDALLTVAPSLGCRVGVSDKGVVGWRPKHVFCMPSDPYAGLLTPYRRPGALMGPGLHIGTLPRGIVESSAVGASHVVVRYRLAHNGEQRVYTYGMNDRGQLGIGIHREFNHRLMPANLPQNKMWVAVAATGYTTLASSTDGLWIWGDVSRFLPSQDSVVWSPERIPRLIGQDGTVLYDEATQQIGSINVSDKFILLVVRDSAEPRRNESLLMWGWAMGGTPFVLAGPSVFSNACRKFVDVALNQCSIVLLLEKDDGYPELRLLNIRRAEALGGSTGGDLESASEVIELDWSPREGTTVSGRLAGGGNGFLVEFVSSLDSEVKEVVVYDIPIRGQRCLPPRHVELANVDSNGVERVRLARMSVGKSHSGVLLANGVAFMWGKDSNGSCLTKVVDRAETVPFVNPGKDEIQKKSKWNVLGRIYQQPPPQDPNSEDQEGRSSRSEKEFADAKEAQTLVGTTGSAYYNEDSGTNPPNATPIPDAGVYRNKDYTPSDANQLNREVGTAFPGNFFTKGTDERSKLASIQRIEGPRLAAELMLHNITELSLGNDFTMLALEADENTGEIHHLL